MATVEEQDERLSKIEQSVDQSRWEVGKIKNDSDRVTKSNAEMVQQVSVMKSKIDAQSEQMQAQSLLLTSISQTLVRLDPANRERRTREKSTLDTNEIPNQVHSPPPGTCSQDDQLGYRDISSALATRESMLRKVDMHVFNGSSPFGWVARMERIFRLGNYSDEQKLDLVSVNMEGPGLIWFNEEMEHKYFKNWADFKQRMLDRFGPSWLELQEKVVLKKELISQNDEEPGKRMCCTQQTGLIKETKGIDELIPQSQVLISVSPELEQTKKTILSRDLLAEGELSKETEEVHEVELFGVAEVIGSEALFKQGKSMQPQIYNETDAMAQSQVPVSFLESRPGDIMLGVYGMDCVVADQSQGIENVKNEILVDFHNDLNIGVWIDHQNKPAVVNFSQPSALEQKCVDWIWWSLLPDMGREIASNSEIYYVFEHILPRKMVGDESTAVSGQLQLTFKSKFQTVLELVLLKEELWLGKCRIKTEAKDVTIHRNKDMIMYIVLLGIKARDGWENEDFEPNVIHFHVGLWHKWKSRQLETVSTYQDMPLEEDFCLELQHILGKHGVPNGCFNTLVLWNVDSYIWIQDGFDLLEQYNNTRADTRDTHMHCQTQGRAYKGEGPVVHDNPMIGYKFEHAKSTRLNGGCVLAVYLGYRLSRFPPELQTVVYIYRHLLLLQGQYQLKEAQNILQMTHITSLDMEHTIEIKLANDSIWLQSSTSRLQSQVAALLILLKSNLLQIQVHNRLKQRKFVRTWMFKYKERRGHVEFLVLTSMYGLRSISCFIWRRWRSKGSNTCAVVRDETLTCREFSFWSWWAILFIVDHDTRLSQQCLTFQLEDKLRLRGPGIDRFPRVICTREKSVVKGRRHKTEEVNPFVD